MVPGAKARKVSYSPSLTCEKHTISTLLIKPSCFRGSGSHRPGDILVTKVIFFSCAYDDLLLLLLLLLLLVCYLYY